MRFVLFVIIVLVGWAIVPAQQITDDNWTTLNGRRNGFSVSLPGKYVVHRSEMFSELTVAAGGNKMTVIFRAIETEMGQRVSGKVLSNPRGEDHKIAAYKKGKFDIQTEIIDGAVFDIAIQATSSEGYYSIHITADKAENPIALAVLRSIKLEGQPLLKRNDGIGDPSYATIDLSALRPTQEVLDVLKHKQTQEIEIVRDTVVSAAPEPAVLYSRPLLILKKEIPVFPRGTLLTNSALIVLLVSFKANGDIGKITVMRPLSESSTKAAIEAAKKTKFLPAEVEGRPVDVTVPIEYTFMVLN